MRRSSPVDIDHGPGIVRKSVAALLLAGTLAITILRAVRLPNEFSKAHWLIDYRFGLVKRGLVGSLVAISTAALRAPVSDGLINGLASLQFAVFCVVLFCLGLRLMRLARWSTPMLLANLAFLSSPFVVMSAHLVGYFDNIVVVLAIASILLLLRGRTWFAVALQTVAIFVHENSLLLGVPSFWLAWLLVRRRSSRAGQPALAVWPLLVPLAAFLAIALSQSLASRHLERSLMTHVSSFPFIQASIPRTRVPHWITITLFDSYMLHRGLVADRLLSTSMLGLILPSTMALLSQTYESHDIGALGWESAAILGVCLVPQSIHILAWDTTRTWTYSILVAFLVLWIYTETDDRPILRTTFGPLMCLVALGLNAVLLTPLMDGLTDQLSLETRLVLYLPIVVAALTQAFASKTYRL